MKNPKTIVITGVTRGLGGAMVEEFIRLGNIVAGCGRSAKEIQRLANQFGAPHLFDAVDVVSDSDVKSWADRILSEKGAPDYLINNAGVINKSEPLWNVSADEFSNVIDVNIKGVANVVRHFVPAMIGRSTGIIVNFSSGWGRSTSPDVAPYCASKWAIEGLTQALAQELPRGLAAIPLNPGIINTEMLRSCFGGSASSYPAAGEWAKRAVPFILSLNTRHNGQPLSAP